MLDPEVAIHTFGTLSSKQEQRIYLGNGARTFVLAHSTLRPFQRKTLAAWWETNQGARGQFILHAPMNNVGTIEDVTVRFKNPNLKFDAFASLLNRTGVELIEVPTAFPTYAITATTNRTVNQNIGGTFISDIQTLIPLVKITPRPSHGAANDSIYLSNRRLTLTGGPVTPQLWQARLLKWEAISQGLNGESDGGRLIFGNADRVMSEYSKSVNLYHADVEFSCFHVDSGTKIDMWKGLCIDFQIGDTDPLFTMDLGDLLHELTLGFPPDKIGELCTKLFNNAAAGCPWSTAGLIGNPVFCDRGFDSPQGCVSHGMADGAPETLPTKPGYFGGVKVFPETIRTRDNSQSGRPYQTRTSQVADTAYGSILPHVYCDFSAYPDVTLGLSIQPRIIAGIDEGDFFNCIAIVSKGPIGAYAGITSTYSPYKLDGQAHHGWPKDQLGLRRSVGHDPTRDLDPDPGSHWLGLSSGGAGIQHYVPGQSGGIAFVEMRRSDPKGFQLDRLATHTMEVPIRVGLGGYYWDAGGVRQLLAGGLTNPVWIMINSLLYAKNIWYASGPSQAALLDLDYSGATAGICATVVPNILGTGSEIQFKYSGIFGDARPLKDWFNDICNTFLGFYSFQFGKLRIGTRINAVPESAFTAAHFILGSLKLIPFRSVTNDITVSFANEEFRGLKDSVRIYDELHAKWRGTATNPEYLPTEMNLPGVTTKSHAARLATTILREKVNGFSEDTYALGRGLQLATTPIAFDVYPGMVISLTADDVPGGTAAFRVSRWTLHEDWSIVIDGASTHPDNYNLLVGPLPPPVLPVALPEEDLFAPANFNFTVATEGKGILTLSNFSCGSYGGSVQLGTFDVYFVAEASSFFGTVVGSITDTQTAFGYAGLIPIAGDYIALDQELLYVVSATPTAPNFGNLVVIRGQLGTTAAAHTRVLTQILNINPAWGCEITVGAGIALHPGDRLVRADTSQQQITGFDPNTGIATLDEPFAAATVGDPVYSDVRLWRVSKKTFAVPFAQRFFSSPYRSKFTAEFPLPYAGVFAVAGTLENTRGIKSEPLYKTYGPDWPYRYRTLGTTRYILPYLATPAGITLDAYFPVSAPESQPFEQAFFDTSGGAGDPIAPPSSIADISPTSEAAAGTVTLGGAASDSDFVHLIFTGANHLEAALWVGVDHAMNHTSTLTAIAASVAAWVNQDEHFAAFYLAKSAGAVISIFDLTGIGGTLAVETAGTITAVATGLTPSLGITRGRRYACAYTGPALRSDLSALSASTGPLVSATAIELKELPISSDGRVTTLEIYATKDGQDEPFFLVATIANGSYSVQDTTPEPGSYGGFPGASQPSGGIVLVQLYQDGNPWFQLRKTAGGSRSNLAHGFGIDPIRTDARVTADIQNGSGSIDLTVVLK